MSISISQARGKFSFSGHVVTREWQRHAFDGTIEKYPDLTIEDVDRLIVEAEQLTRGQVGQRYVSPHDKMIGFTKNLRALRNWMGEEAAEKARRLAQYMPPKAA